MAPGIWVWLSPHPVPVLCTDVCACLAPATNGNLRPAVGCCDGLLPPARGLPRLTRRLQSPAAPAPARSRT